jgi:ribokinase
MVTKVGTDVFGKATIENFSEKGVSTKYVFQSNTATGCAPILVEDSGENSIVIVGGANDEMTEAELDKISEVLPRCGLLLCQLEIPFAHTEYALNLAKKAKVRTLLNSAPAVAIGPLLDLTSILVANETEIYQVLEEEVLKEPTIDQTRDAAFRLFRKGKASLECVIVTMGSRGCILTFQSTEEILSEEMREGEWRKSSEEGLCQVFVPSSKVEKVVDTTGAGDCFVGSFSFFLSQGRNSIKATRAATLLAGLSVQKEGTQSSYPANLPESFVW